MKKKDCIQIEIDQITLDVKEGDRLIDVADANGIDIPRFCYHKKLSVAANCRMCLVELENVSKPVPACATTVSDGMKIFTKSEKTLAAQKSVMEFLLINHPLDCPICDQGGECDLQDLAVGYGNDFSRYSEPKRIVQDKNLGSLISTDMTRCIHCTRCVRFGKEIAGVVEMGGLGRGEHMEIGTYVEQSLTSELSGNIIDLCPVGALTSKPFRFQARNWELTSTPSIAPHDAFGSNILIQSINQKIVRVLPDTNEAINEIWLSDRDRFSYLGLYSEDRLEAPMIRNKKGELEVASWQMALEVVGKKLLESKAENSKNTLGVLMSPNSTIEEFYLANKLITHFDHPSNISCKLRHQSPMNSAGFLDVSIAEIEEFDTIVLIGCDIRTEMPLLAHRVRKAHQKGAQVFNLDLTEKPTDFGATVVCHQTDDLIPNLHALINLLAGKPAEKPNKAIKALAKILKSNKKSLLLMGHEVAIHNDFNLMYAAVSKLSEQSQSPMGLIDIGANTKGAVVAGLYHGPQKTSYKIAKTCNNLLLFGTELSADSGMDFNTILADKHFVVACSAYLGEEHAKHADVVLPIANFGEHFGTFINIQNDWQHCQAACRPLGEARPGWKVLRVIANQLNLDGFEYISADEVLQSCRNQTKELKLNLGHTGQASNKTSSIHMYQTDSLVRRSDALQAQNTSLKAKL